VAGDPFGGSQSAVLVLPHHLTIFFRTRVVFFEFWEKYDSNPIKKFGHFYVVTKQKNRDGHSIPTSCISSNTYSYYKRIIISV
jgi:hypothetical protein